MFRRKSLVMLPILILGSVALTGCKEGPVSSTLPIPPTSTSVPDSSGAEEDVYEIIDVLTPRSLAYSKEYNIEQKLEAAEVGKDPDFCLNLIQAVTLDHLTDGDTLTVNITCKGEQKKQAIRFYNVDTPETHHPSKGTEPWGMAAAQYTQKRITEALTAGKKLIIEGGVTGIEYTYERAVGYIWVDGVLLNAQLAEIGLATASVGNARQERHASLFKASNDDSVSWWRVPANGYRPNMKDKAMENIDPNWDYTRVQECSGQPIESNVCIKDQDYQYRFEEVGPTQPIE